MSNIFHPSAWGWVGWDIRHWLIKFSLTHTVVLYYVILVVPLLVGAIMADQDMVNVGDFSKLKSPHKFFFFFFFVLNCPLWHAHSERYVCMSSVTQVYSTKAALKQKGVSQQTWFKLHQLSKSHFFLSFFLTDQQRHGQIAYAASKIFSLLLLHSYFLWWSVFHPVHTDFSKLLLFSSCHDLFIPLIVLLFLISNI